MDDAVRYETCQIVYGRSAKTGQVVFAAEAVGDAGPYTASESEPLQWDALTYLGAESRGVLDRLLADLVAQGWADLGTYAFYYWDHRLRRQLAMPAPVQQRVALPPLERVAIGATTA